MNNFQIGDRVTIKVFGRNNDAGVIVGEPLVNKCKDVCVDLKSGQDPSAFKFWCVKLDSTGEIQNLCEEHLSKKIN